MKLLVILCSMSIGVFAVTKTVELMHAATDVVAHATSASGTAS